MSDQEFADKCVEVVEQFRKLGGRIVAHNRCTNIYDRGATLFIEVVRPEVKQLAGCKMCTGTGGHHTHEGSDMELVWNPCRYCNGKGQVEEV